MRLANIGQAYGAISALLSGAALIAVSYSLILQQRTNMVNQWQANRAVHMDLMKMEMEDPVITDNGAESEDARNSNRYHMRLNLWYSYWLMCWEVGDLREKYAQRMAERFMQKAGRRDFWGLTREGRKISAEDESTLSHLRLWEIFDKEYSVASLKHESSNEAKLTPDGDGAQTTSILPISQSQCIGLAAIALFAVALVRCFQRR
ncbi:DUF6082 family protein [Crossiella sp. SN42]|uniref:DUF6082 family protein n=1 Tax=Crossiella sp. SN42 TaxID=2944808 RepID=UPI00207D3C76|nr:DUF6082 family protein [Crossiella sp. SN42]MCO1575350.1 DUF6082 family protein [Crossiella sp. SN42]